MQHHYAPIAAAEDLSTNPRTHPLRKDPPFMYFLVLYVEILVVTVIFFLLAVSVIPFSAFGYV